MAKDDRLYLGNMWDMTRRARRLLGDTNLNQFLKDETLRFALAHLVQIIGEAASHVSEATRTSLPDIEWDEIVGMRQDRPRLSEREIRTRLADGRRRFARARATSRALGSGGRTAGRVLTSVHCVRE